MRCDQHAGLAPSARDFLLAHEIPAPVCLECRRPFTRNLEVAESYFGMFGDRYDLYRHRLMDGRYADEYVQDAPWESGPIFFIGLRVYDAEGNITDTFEWPEEKIP